MKKILGLACLILLIDQASKIYVKTHFLLHGEVRVFSWFYITYVENPGMAYGFQWGGFFGKIGLSLLRLVLIAFMAYYINKWSKKTKSWLFVFPAGFIFAGAIGNLIDSIFYGVMFDAGTTYNAALSEWFPYFGVSRLDFSGYAPLFGGCVVDMFRFTFFNYIFNIADSAITVGAAFLFGVYIFKPEIFKEIGLNDSND
ncbi:MAG: signal peptidase II [Flavobacteriaceae bacterium]|jgi:signal peptidase II|nr:signal peptidase II [Flavobacteriaceae bacterium]